MRPFTCERDALNTHLDPDWRNLTYGECVTNGRGAALKQAAPDDVLLFWGLLFPNSGRDWSGFTGERGWYLFGAMRIAWIMEGGQRLRDVPEVYRSRASENAHIEDGGLESGERILIASLQHSALFQKAIDLGADSVDGLMFRAFTTAAGERIVHGSTPHWSGTLRACRCMFDLKTEDGRDRATLVGEAIRSRNDFDLL